MAAGTNTGPLFSAIKKDHDEIFTYYDQYRKATSLDEQTRWSNQLMWEVARHSAGEEIVVYPLFEKHLGADGKKMADHDREDHQLVKNNLSKLEGMTVGSQEYNALLQETMTNLREHAISEEQHDLPSLENALNRDESQATANSFQRTKKFVPTRAHPSAPDKPPFETLAGFLAAPMDKLKDAFSKFPTEEMKENVI
ncbi:hypothetical protein BD410DRAFT_453300 [Rickenella mellea]|uniref:Hemerythrin-like domain-containing protein n=1 Tax=Rickenella mellea TaxID=50990 RepID=A0A4Y7PWU9_9AGAM|nr:hypothetical protein BD410DRAFT_453300 [Rickenella mellea]